MDGNLPTVAGAGAGNAKVIGNGGVGTTSRPCGASPVTPGASGGGNGSGSSTGSLPPAAASGARTFPWQDGVYTPTSHKGAPGQGDGLGSLSRAGGSSPAGGTGPHSRVGWWRGSNGPGRRGIVAVPHAVPDKQNTVLDQGTAGGGGGTRQLGLIAPPPPAPLPLSPPAPYAGRLVAGHRFLLLMARGPRRRRGP